MIKTNMCGDIRPHWTGDNWLRSQRLCNWAEPGRLALADLGRARGLGGLKSRSLLSNIAVRSKLCRVIGWENRGDALRLL
jgi:hypothetical protein